MPPPGSYWSRIGIVFVPDASAEGVMDEPLLAFLNPPVNVHVVKPSSHPFAALAPCATIRACMLAVNGKFSSYRFR